jgi:hypothetical protein
VNEGPDFQALVAESRHRNLPDPTGHAWEDAHAAAVRRALVHIAINASELAPGLRALDSLLGPGPLTQYAEQVEAIHRWATDQIKAVGITEEEYAKLRAPKNRSRRMRMDRR